MLEVQDDGRRDGNPCCAEQSLRLGRGCRRDGIPCCAEQSLRLGRDGRRVGIAGNEELVWKRNLGAIWILLDERIHREKKN